jgi:hypothetical protein
MVLTGVSLTHRPRPTGRSLGRIRDRSPSRTEPSSGLLERTKARNGCPSDLVPPSPSPRCTPSGWPAGQGTAIHADLAVLTVVTGEMRDCRRRGRARAYHASGGRRGAGVVAVIHQARRRFFCHWQRFRHRAACRRLVPLHGRIRAETSACRAARGGAAAVPHALRRPVAAARRRLQLLIEEGDQRFPRPVQEEIACSRTGPAGTCTTARLDR